METLPVREPEYRAFMLMDNLPAGCIAFPVTNDLGAPHLRPGEFAVIDTGDRDLRSGEIYLIQWQSPGAPRELVSIKWTRAFNRDAWWVGAPAYPWRKPGAKKMTLAEGLARASVYGTIDGPYADEDYLRSKLVGRVVGVLEAVQEGPLRLTGSAY